MVARLVAGSASAVSWQDQLSNTASLLSQSNKDNTTFTSRNHNRSPPKRKRANLAVGSFLHLACSASGINDTHQRLSLSG